MSDKFGINVSGLSSSGVPAAPVPELPAAVPASSARAPAKRTRQSSPAKSSKHRTAEGEMVTELIEPPQAGSAARQAEDALSSLPPELLAIIIRKLDTSSICNLRNTSRHLKNVVHSPGVVKELDLSLSTLATVKTKLDIFHDISGHVRVLNLSGVYDLDRAALVCALEHMESLVDLDVSFTKITMIDFLKFRKVRPTLKGIAINFDLEDRLQVCEEDVLQYQQAFEGFRTVHFVYTGTCVRISRLGKAAFLMLLKADLLRFTLTIASGDCSNLAQYYEKTIDWNITDAMCVSQFHLNLLEYPLPPCDWDEDREEGKKPEMPLLRFMEVDKCEIISFACKHTQVLATPLVKKTILEHYAVQVDDLPESTPFSYLNDVMLGYTKEHQEIFIMLWYRERNRFDGEFRSQLLSIFKEYYVFSVSDTLTQVPPGLKWHRIAHDISPELSTVELNHGDAFKEHDDIKLDLSFNGHYKETYLESLKVINDYNFLKKISHLSITTRRIHYKPGIFNNVLKHCEGLVTFQTADPMLLRFAAKNKSLKNVYVEGHKSDLRPTFDILSKCRTLECFVYMGDGRFIRSLPDPKELFRKCGNLYYICIKVDIKPSYKEDMILFYKKVKSKLRRDHLTIEIRDEDQPYYTPYMNVFNVYQFRPM